MRYDKETEELYKNVYQTYQNDVYKISLYYTNDEYISQDITQKTFMKLYLHFSEINIESVRAYLFRSARNLAYNWTRDLKRGIHCDWIENISEEEFALASLESKYIVAEETRKRQEFMSNIMQELYEENESWYDVLILIYGMEKDHEKVAEEMGYTKEVLYSKLYRAKRWIRKKFQNEYEQL